MTPDAPPPDPADDAAELALGLLAGAERAAALRRVLSDADFARQVAWWRERFSGLLDDYQAVAAPDHLLPEVAAGRAAPTSTRAASYRWPWFAGGAVAGALAASLIAAVAVDRAPPTIVRVPTPAARTALPLIAVLIPSAGDERKPVAAWLASDGTSLRLTEAVAVPQGRSAELWAIGADQVPRALGVLSPTGRSSRLSDAAGRPRSGDTLAISIEPEGGSPTGAPTGPVIASGVMVMT